jgi:hypothetical protein
MTVSHDMTVSSALSVEQLQSCVFSGPLADKGLLGSPYSQYGIL